MKWGTQGCAASSAVLWISILHGLSDGISIGSSRFSWGKGTKIPFHNSPKNPAQLSVAKRRHGFTADPAADVTKQHPSHQVVHLKIITCLLILMMGYGSPPDLGICSSRICEKAKAEGLSWSCRSLWSCWKVQKLGMVLHYHIKTGEE